MENFLFVILGVVGIIIFLQIIIRLRSWTKKGKPAPEVSGALGRSIRKGETVLAYFYSPACSACRAQEKYLPKVQEKFGNIFRVNAAKDRDLSSAFGVMGTPTSVVIKNGIIQAYFVGITAPDKLLKSLKT